MTWRLHSLRQTELKKWWSIPAIVLFSSGSQVTSETHGPEISSVSLLTTLPSYTYSGQMSNSNKGHYQCPRCNSVDIYETTETTGAMAFTLNTPGPVDPTIVNPIRNQVFRCRDCGEKARWIPNPSYIAAKMKREAKVMPWVSGPFTIVFAALGIWVFNDPWLRESGTGIGVGDGITIISGILEINNCLCS